MSETGCTPLGPGTAVLVVGASGVGKDTLLDGAARLLHSEPHVVFVRRAITRPPHGSEAFEAVTRGDFDAARARGGYALSWEAHGLGYGIPVSTDAEVELGHTLVINASRTIVQGARRRYANAKVVLIHCPRAIRVARLAARGRESVLDIEARLDRSVDTFGPADADATIDNAGTSAVGIAHLAELLRSYAAAHAAAGRPALNG